MTNSEDEKCFEKVKRRSFLYKAKNVYRHWSTKYVIICTVLTLLFLITMTQRVSSVLFEIRALTDSVFNGFLAVIRYMTLISIVVASFYAIVRFNLYKIVGKRYDNGKETICSTKTEPNSDLDYSVSVLKEPISSKPCNWEKTVEDCWFNLNIASVRLKANKDKIAAGAQESKNKLRQISDSLQKLEVKTNHRRALKSDVALNTDLPIDPRLRVGCSDLESTSDSSVSSQTPSDVSTTSSGIKYNILEKVIEMGDVFDSNDHMLKRTKSKSLCIPRPVEPPPIPPIQQWTMPKDIFTFSTTSTYASRFS